MPFPSFPKEHTMPTETELRNLFHDAPAPLGSLDAAAIIRRSKRRRLPQQVGAGSVLTLAVAGIGVASINGLQGLTPMSASETAADAPMGVSEEADTAVPWVDSGTSLRLAPCETVTSADAQVAEGVTFALGFPATATTGETVVGTLRLTNTGSTRIVGVAANPAVSLAKDGESLLYRDRGSVPTEVDLVPGESTSIAFSFNAVECDAQGEATGAPLESGAYTLSGAIELRPETGPSRLVSGPASAITLR
jgi:hypothetical protein